ncbi:MAG: mannose-1-phosphate guanylyltransferase [candidate division NC10 bacterium]|nr:mannose-1-phosphate guanylyltransferase [candidate division NC10 bacterium]
MATVYAIILAGGLGERFWPLGTPERPKPFLRLLEGKSFLQATVERMRLLIPLSCQLVVTGRSHAGLVRGEVPDLPEENLLLEPEGRNTAVAIGLASLHLEQKDPEAALIALPADHAIPDEALFLKALERGIAAALAQEGTVVFGIPPDRPETGYGYIQRGQKIEEGLYQVHRFWEKPDLPTAEGFLRSGDYFWNSGIFVWRNRVLQRLLERHLPDHWQSLSRLREVWGTEVYNPLLQAIYARLEGVSIDSGVLEKAEGTVMVHGGFRWDDVGTWAALARVLPRDPSGNIVMGRHLGLETKDCVIYSSGRMIGTVGLEGLIIVETEQGILVATKEKSQEVRRMARLAKKASLEG